MLDSLKKSPFIRSLLAYEAHLLTADEMNAELEDMTVEAIELEWAEYIRRTIPRSVYRSVIRRQGIPASEIADARSHLKRMYRTRLW